MNDLYAEIILPITGSCYTYTIGKKFADIAKAGCAVSVQFGTRKIVTGIIHSVHSRKPYYKKLKPILGMMYHEPVVDASQLKLWEWIADYYMCSIGAVMRSAIPVMLKPSGFTFEEYEEELFKPRKTIFISISPSLDTERKFNEACERLRFRAKRQYEGVMEIVEKLGERLFTGEIARSSIRIDSSALHALCRKDIIVMNERETPANSYVFTEFPLPTLTPPQQEAYKELREKLQTKDTALLFGVPSAGKSEICFHAIASALSRGNDVLLLQPEISLTTQFVRRLRDVFGDRVVLYHSGLPDRRRAETYLDLMHRDGGSLIVGARSAIFLPMKRLELVIVDEEQDSSYKQQDPAPRYNARDTAIVLAKIHKARVILSSATPSLESWSNAWWGKYGLVMLTERYGKAPAPRVIISDTIKSAKRGERKSHFNKELLDRMKKALELGEQVILFQNRRGTAPYIECAKCGWVPHCSHCGIPMTVHRSNLRCHYCGTAAVLPPVCPKCGGIKLETRGFGTEKIEDELALLFPNARTQRLDRDTAGSEKSYRSIITAFERQEIDILVGTQMVTKGLDFGGVSLVGVLNADNLLNHPDFRASERAYQLIAQVAGRAGRRDKRGTVVVQTATPGHPIINLAAMGDYGAMAAEILAERALYKYPPYSRLVSVILRHRERDSVYAAARKFEELLRPTFRDLLLGPQPPTVERIKGDYALVFLIKVPREMSLSQVRERLKKTSINLRTDPAVRKTIITPNVDPQ